VGILKTFFSFLTSTSLNRCLHGCD